MHRSAHQSASPGLKQLAAAAASVLELGFWGHEAPHAALESVVYRFSSRHGTLHIMRKDCFSFCDLASHQVVCFYAATASISMLYLQTDNPLNEPPKLIVLDADLVKVRTAYTKGISSFDDNDWQSEDITARQHYPSRHEQNR